jgi:hypothetical protein
MSTCQVTTVVGGKSLAIQKRFIDEFANDEDFKKLKAEHDARFNKDMASAPEVIRRSNGLANHCESCTGSMFMTACTVVCN